MKFTLDARLDKDCLHVNENDTRILLLLDNAHYCWLVIVPKVDVIEWFELEPNMQQLINDEVNRLSRWLKQSQGAEKINVATIGNVVSQLHIHVVGRKTDDPAWPGVVWGHTERKEYQVAEAEALINQLCQNLKLD